MRICVFCASSAKVAPVFFEAAEVFARNVVAEGHTIVYGGGAMGLMGRIADVVIANQGCIVGIMPHFMKQVEWNHEGLQDLILVDTMHQRKALMIQNADAVVALPGGCGTLEELMEIITLKRLGKFTHPVIIVNINGFYDHLLAFFDTMMAAHFMRPEHKEAWTVVKNAADILPAIKQQKPWRADAIHYATV